MKNSWKSLATIFLMSMMVASCGQKEVITNNNTSSGSSSSGGSTGGSGSNGGSTSPITGCDGVYRSGATSCYYKNLPELTFSGPGTYGTTIWSSASDLSGTGISTNQFVTDATFSVRMVPSNIKDGRTSKQGRVCSKYRTDSTKVRVYVMLRKSSASLGEVAKLEATYSGSKWNFSNTWRYTVPGGTTDPYILEIIGVQTNERCLGGNGTPPASCSTEPFMDIPVVNSPNPTSCIGVTLQMATDETYDLPN